MQSSAKPIATQPATAEGEGQLRRGARRLILTRHAKAVEEDGGGDHSRGLSERGVADAQALAAWLAAGGLQPDSALCSTAARTRQTLEIIAPSVATILSDRLYLATVGDLLAQVQATDDAVHTLLLVCHNPGAHGLLAMLVDSCATPADADRMLLKFPTSACAVMTFNTPRWRAVAPRTGRLDLLRY